MDSSSDALDYNKESIEELCNHLGDELGKKFPLVITLNKRDLVNALPRGKLLDVLNLRGYPVYETIATEGMGVKNAFKSLAREVLNRQISEIAEHVSTPLTIS